MSGHSFPLLGVEVQTGPAHTWGPVYFYLLTAPFAISRDPSVAVAFVCLITCVSVLLAYRLTAAFFGRGAAIFAAALFAAYPRIVIAEHTISNGALVPCVTLIFFHSLFDLSVRRRSRSIILAIAALGVLLQLHLATLSLVVILCLALALFHPPLRIHHLLLGLATGLLLLSPYLVAQVLSGFADISAFLAYSKNYLAPRSLWGLCRLAGYILVTFPEEIVSSFLGITPSWRTRLAAPLNRLETWLLVLGIAFVLVVVLRGIRQHAQRDPRLTAFGLLALWLIVPFLVLGQKADLAPHQLELLYPAPFIAAGAMLSAISGARPLVRLPYLRAGVYVLVALIVVTDVVFLREVYNATSRNGAMAWNAPADASRARLELMPIRDKQRLVRALVEEFGLDRERFYSRVHGSRFRDLLEDKGYFFETTDKARADHPPGPAPLSPLHYFLDRRERVGDSTSGQHVAVIGPYAIAAYVPRIDYETWTCSYRAPSRERVTVAGHRRDGFPLGLPTARAPDLSAYWTPAPRSWRSLPVYCAGTITRARSDLSRLSLVVSIRTLTSETHDVVDLRVNTREIASRQVFSHSTISAYSREVWFDATNELQVGQNDLTMRIEGRGLQFDLDVYDRPSNGQ